MSSPAKRRKTNKHTDSPRRTQGLDFFFAKQQQGQSIARDEQNEDVALTTIPALETSRTNLSPETRQNLSDEALARKLQEEWNKEDTSSQAGVQRVTEEESQQARKDVATFEDDLYAETEVTDAIQPPRPMDDENAENLDVRAQSQGLGREATKPMNSDHTLSLQSATASEDIITSTIPFDESPLTFEPMKYIPDLQKQWAIEGGPATYALLTRGFILVNSTQSRLKIVDTLVNLLRVLIEGDPESLLPAVWLATNSISPPYIDLELGLGGSAISKALKKVCGLSDSGLRALFNKHGDAGDVAFEAKKKQSLTLRKPKPLSIKSVFESLAKIANSKGHGSVESKQRIVERLVQDARGAEESRYIVRTLVQHLRIGAVKTTMLIALSRAFLLSHPPNAEYSCKPQHELRALKKDALTEIWSRGEEIVKACFARRPNYNDLVPTLLEIGVCDELLLRCGLALHIPLRPMLGNITRDLGEMLTKLQGRDFSCEYKYDGQRAQVHCDEKGKVTIFSRHLEIMTDKYPDLVALVPKLRGEGVGSFIMEGEVVAIDRDSGDLKTFQVLSNRARKDVVIGSVKIDVCLFAFDLMYLNGEELLSRPFRERRELLRSLFMEIPRHFTWVKNLDATSADSDAVLEFFQGALDIKCEGIMVKILDNMPNVALLEATEEINNEDTTLAAKTAPPTPSKSKKASKSRSKTNADPTKPNPLPPSEDDPDANPKNTTPSGARRKALLSTYEPDKRVDSWLKVKKDYSASADTLDLIPIGAWHGNGRKAAWWSPILLAARHPTTGAFVAVTKCMSGFTDKFYAANREKYAPGSTNVVSRPAYVEYVGEPDVWFMPQEVWEVQFADLSRSPTYTAGNDFLRDGGERGLSTRFPRFLKVREDKGLEEATNCRELADMYVRQESGVKKEQGEKNVVEDDEWY